MEQKEIIAGLREARESLASYLRSLPPDAWEHASLCEGWSVGDVVAHLVGNCADVLEQNLDDVGSSAYNQRQIDERKGRTAEELLGEWDDKGPGCEAVYEAMPPELWAYEMPPPLGTIGQGVLRQLEDLWVHTQDIRIPLGADPTAGPGLTAALELVAHEVEPLLRKYAPDVGALELDLPDVRTTIPGAGSRTVTISGDPVAFALVATGRWRLDGAEAEGRLSVDGELPAAQRVLHIYGEDFERRP